jgi:hypothetical protein
MVDFIMGKGFYSASDLSFFFFFSCKRLHVTLRISSREETFSSFYFACSGVGVTGVASLLILALTSTSFPS